MEVITIAVKIEKKIAELEAAREMIFDAAQEKANGISNYDRAIAITTLKLKNKQITHFEGVAIETLPATLIAAVAKGICFQECFDKEAKDSIYRGLITQIEAIKAELNGLQSINKHLE